MNKREMRREAIKRLTDYKNDRKIYNCTMNAIVGDVFRETTTYEDIGLIIDLLTDDDEDMGDYVKVPMDADGVPIHIGDRVVEHEDGHGFIVDGYEYDGEWWVFHGYSIRAQAHVCTHYKVMDVLSELVEKVYESAWSDGKEGVRYDMCEFEKLIKEYAEKLQLKEDADGRC